MNEADNELLTYEPVSVSALEVLREVQACLRDLQDPQSAASQALLKDAPTELKTHAEGFDQLLRVRSSGAGFVEGGAEIVVAILGTGLAAQIGKDLWKYVILPHLRRKFGDHAIKEKAKREKAKQVGQKKGSKAR